MWASDEFQYNRKARKVITSVSRKDLKDPAKGQEQAISGNTNPYIFLPIRDTPINVYILRES